MIDYYDRQGHQIDAMRWAELVSDRDYCIVGVDTIGNVTVSTVWLGLERNLMANGPPLMFETLIFHHGIAGDGCWRYPSEAAAIAGHDQVLSAVRDGKGALL